MAALFVNDRILIPEAELELRYSRSSGPGGQNVNKVNSKAQLRWNAVDSAALPPDVRDRFFRRYGNRLTEEGELLLQSERFRDQRSNAEDCREKLRDILLSVAEAPKPRKKTKPTRGSQKRRRESKRRQGEKKRDRAQRNWD